MFGDVIFVPPNVISSFLVYFRLYLWYCLKRNQPNKQNIKMLALESRNISVNMRIKALVAV
jgi:hypothetical protein